MLQGMDTTRNCKIGIIYQKFGQINESEIFQNQHETSSIEFCEFLDVIATCIQLKNFKRYTGGLDTNFGQSGERSYYTEFKKREIMFHVSTLLPYDSAQPGCIEQKRHIGNDLVVVIFQDQYTPFKPRFILSSYTHVYVIIYVGKGSNIDTFYNISVLSRLQKCLPFSFTNPCIYKKGPNFRQFFLNKLLFAETAVYNEILNQRLSKLESKREIQSNGQSTLEVEFCNKCLGC